MTKSLFETWTAEQLQARIDGNRARGIGVSSALREALARKLAGPPPLNAMTALDRIARELDAQEWTVDTLDRIASICQRARRIIRDTPE